MDEPPRTAGAFRLIGAGFGPANLAVGLSLSEHPLNSDRLTGIRFFESQPKFGWHTGMLLPNASMQISFLKDLATQRDPMSRYSFLNYLQLSGRLSEFINLRTFYPSRREFHAYLEWCSASLQSIVQYGTQVTKIEPLRDQAKRIAYLKVTTRSSNDGLVQEHLTKNVLLGCGLTPQYPQGIRSSARIFHSADLLNRVVRMDQTRPTTFIVAGGGQSAVECILHLHENFPRGRIISVQPKYALLPADSSEFVNRIFNSEELVEFRRLDPEVRLQLLSDHRATNYGAVDPALIARLHRIWYEEKVSSESRIELRNLSRVSGIVEDDSGLRVEIESRRLDDAPISRADYLVCATGYSARFPDFLLSPDLVNSIRRTSSGSIVVGEDHKVSFTDDCDVVLYNQVAGDLQAGLGSTLLSNIAVRAGDLADDLLRREVARSRFNNLRRVDTTTP